MQKLSKNSQHIWTIAVQIEKEVTIKGMHPFKDKQIPEKMLA